MTDHCDYERKKVADLMNALADNQRQANDAWGDEAAIELKIAIDTAAVNSAHGRRARANAHARLRRDNHRRAVIEERIQERQANEDELMDKLRNAAANLKMCEELYGIQGCGSRGGVGVRRPDGKCAGWDDWRNAEGGFY